MNKVIVASMELGHVFHESTYHSSVLREHPNVDSFEKTWKSWEDPVQNIGIYSQSWYPSNSCEYSGEYSSDDSEET